MQNTSLISQRSRSRPVRSGTRRSKILDYIARQGGELRSESGQGLRRQICEALGERPAPVSQALLALEKAGLLEREIDVERRRCHAIRLVSGPAGGPGSNRPPSDSPGGPERRRIRAELEAAEQDLADSIRRAAEASRRVQHLRWSLLRAPEGRPEDTGGTG